ncbi:mechanosensitive ion channel family protein [Chitinimonas taiwanensis]|uniref:mechanosensitive ion channel family protein n=1 Tax=Chitinimonas taiwanensis TaxID=240412 RepID=UPI0035B3A017
MHASLRFLLCLCLMCATLTGRAAPVMLDGTAIYQIDVPFKGSSAAQRAADAGQRLQQAAQQGLPAQSVRVVDSELGTDLMLGDTYLSTVFDSDAAAAGLPRTELAQQQAQAVAAALSRYQRAHSEEKLWLGVLYAALTLLAAFVLGHLLNRTYRRLHALIVGASRRSMRKLEHRTHHIVRAAPLLQLLGGLLRLGRLLLFVLLLYLTVELLLSYFATTRPYAGRLLGWMLAPLQQGGLVVAEQIPKLFFLAVLIIVTRYLLRVIRYLFREIERGNLRFEGFYPDWARPTQKIVSFLLIAFALMVAYPYIPGSESAAFKGVSLFLGVLFSLGSTGAISNLVAGVILTYMRAYRQGDLVRIGDSQGVVVSHSLLVTKLFTIRNQEITIPNSVVLQGHVTNLSSGGASRGALVSTAVTIGYDTPWRQVHALLLEAAAQTEEVLKTPAPFVLQTELQDFYIRYELNVYTDQPQRLPFVLSALNASVQDSFNRHGVQIMSPHFFDRARGPVLTPPEHWYEAPARRPEGGAE